MNSQVFHFPRGALIKPVPPNPCPHRPLMNFMQHLCTPPAASSLPLVSSFSLPKKAPPRVSVLLTPFYGPCTCRLQWPLARLRAPAARHLQVSVFPSPPFVCSPSSSCAVPTLHMCKLYKFQNKRVAHPLYGVARERQSPPPSAGAAAQRSRQPNSHPAAACPPGALMAPLKQPQGLQFHSQGQGGST